MPTRTILMPSGGGPGMLSILKHLKSLGQSDNRIIVCDTRERSVATGIADYYYRAPEVLSDEYDAFIRSICERHSVDVVIPGIGADVRFFADRREELLASGTVAAVSSAEACTTALHKAASFAALHDAGIPVPEHLVVTSAEEFRIACTELGYPDRAICIKPSQYPDGSGKGFRIVDPALNVHARMFRALPSEMFYVTRDAIIESMEREVDFPPMLVMELLPFEEYSVYCFCDGREARHIVCNLRQELLGTNTKEAVVVANPLVEGITRDVCGLFGFEYNVNIQVKLSRDRIPKVIEINPRLAGTVMLPVAAGVDMLALTLLKAAGKAIPRCLPIRYGTTIRRTWADSFGYEPVGELCGSG